MAKATPFDCQLADLIWVMATALRAGYRIQQAFEQLASNAPEPAASACAQVVSDLNSGQALDQALTNWQKTVQSTYLKELVAAMLKQQQTGGNLPDLIEPIGEAIWEKNWH